MKKSFGVGSLVLMMGLAGWAQSPLKAQTMGGGGNTPDIQIDRSVLDSLGPQPTLPDLLRGKTPRQRLVLSPPIHLHPPRHGRQVAQAKTETKTEPAGKKVVTVVAAKPAKKAVTAAATPAPPASAPSPSTASPSTLVPAAPAPSSEAAPSSAPDNQGPTKLTVANGPVTTPPPAAPSLPSSPPTQDIKPQAPVAPLVAAQPPPPPPQAKPTEAAPTVLVPAAPPVPAVPDTTASAPKPSAPPAAVSPPASQMAMATPMPTGPAGDRPMSQILFDKDVGGLSDDARSALMSVASTLAADPSAHLLVIAYAQGTPDQDSNARRLSLSRALAVRSFLIDQGINSLRIDLRALGNKIPDGPPDRVDLMVQKH